MCYTTNIIHVMCVLLFSNNIFRDLLLAVYLLKVFLQNAADYYYANATMLCLRFNESTPPISQTPKPVANISINEQYNIDYHNTVHNKVYVHTKYSNISHHVSTKTNNSPHI